MPFSAENYRAASQERIADAQDLHERRRYVLAHNMVGVAVECILRAYRLRISSEFTARHDLYELASQTKFFQSVPESEYAQTYTALIEVSLRWQNDHRYRSEAALKTFLRRAELVRGIRGDILKESSRRAVTAAATVVRVGVSQWRP